MNEIKLPIKYALFPLKDKNLEGNTDTVAYIIAKCYLLECRLEYNLDGTLKGICKVIECKNAREAIKDGKVDESYVYEVSCVFNDIDLAVTERDRVNDFIVSKLKDAYDDNTVNQWNIKIDKMVKSIEKLRSISEKKFMITTEETKKLIYTKE